MNSHLERAIQKAMAELDKQSEKATAVTTTMTTSSATAIKSGKGNTEKKNHSPKSTKTTRTIKIAPAPK